MTVKIGTERIYLNQDKEISVTFHTEGSADADVFISPDGTASTKPPAAGSNRLAAERTTFDFYKSGNLKDVSYSNTKDGSYTRMIFEDGGAGTIRFGSQDNLKHGALRNYLFDSADKLPGGQKPFSIEKFYQNGHLVDFRLYTKDEQSVLKVKVSLDTREVTGSLKLPGLKGTHEVTGKGFIDNLDKIDTAQLFADGGKSIEKLSNGSIKLAEDDGGGILLGKDGTLKLLDDADHVIGLVTKSGLVDTTQPALLIGQDGAGLIGQDGAGLIGQDGAGLIGQDGSGLSATSSGQLVAAGAGNLVAAGAGNLVAQGAGNIAHARVEAHVAASTSSPAVKAVPLSGGELLGAYLTRLAATDDKGVLASLNLGKAGSQEQALDILTNLLSGQKSAEKLIQLAASLKADLKVTKVAVADASLHPGDKLTVDWEVSNIGKVALNASTSLAWLSKDTKLGNADDILIGRGHDPLLFNKDPHADTVTYQLPANLMPGTYYVIVNANGDGQAKEDGTNNQSKPVAATVTSSAKAPDLVIAGAAADKASAGAGDTVTVSYTLKEAALLAAGASETAVYLSTDRTITTADHQLAIQADPKLSPGGSYPGEISFTLPSNYQPGTYYLGVIANADGKLHETDRLNDASKPIAFTIKASTGPVDGVDLAAHDLSVASTALDQGDAISLTYDVSNYGNETVLRATGTIYLSKDAVFGGDDLVLSSDSEILEGGETQHHARSSFQIPTTLADGTYYVGVVANGGDREVRPENDASNAVKITVGGPGVPDLAINSGAGVTVTKSTVPAGSSDLATYYLVNNGKGAAHASHTGIFLSDDASFSKDDTLVGKVDSGALGAAGSSGPPYSYSYEAGMSFTVPASKKPGTYYVCVVADYDKAIAESDETNNVSNFVKLTVTAPKAQARAAVHQEGGADTFLFDLGADGKIHAATVDGFGRGDTFHLEADAFPDLNRGALSASAFHFGAQAADAGHRILYDKAHGDLYFDREGSGTTYERVKFAEVADRAAIDHTDFLVV